MELPYRIERSNGGKLYSTANRSSSYEPVKEGFRVSYWDNVEQDRYSEMVGSVEEADRRCKVWVGVLPGGGMK